MSTTGAPASGNVGGTRSGELVTLGVRQPVLAYLRSMWARRDFAIALAKNDLRSRHMNSALGQAWYLMNPALNIAIYFLIFGVVLNARRGVESYVSFLVIGVMFFRLTQNAVINCASCITKNTGLIRSIQFPRALIPVSVLIEATLQFIPSILLIALVTVVDADAPMWNWLGIPLILAATVTISLGLGLVAARIGAFLTDLQQLLPHFFRIMLYVSGVLFAVDDRIENETIRRLFVLNPFYDIIEGARWAFMGRPLSGGVAVGLVVWSIGSLVAGLLLFKRGEHRYGA
jgi:teichoic acid transport system permease protein